MNIGIIDADLIGIKKHRFPNLVCMKLSSYYKQNGDNVTLLLDYDTIDDYDKVFISKVFVKTEIPFEDKSIEKLESTVEEVYKNNPILNKPNVEYGGTGFYYDKSPRLPDYIEHIMPDYHLYDDYVKSVIEKGSKKSDYAYFTDYSIGFLTRGCFRKCAFCVNKHYDRCSVHSNIKEFYDSSRPKLCFLDDNFFACPNWKEIIEEVKEIGKPFQFRQGLDERLLTKDKIKEISSWKYDKSLTFAFDNIEDRKLIEDKMNLLYSECPDFKKVMTFYVFCGFDREGKYDDNFWKEDIKNTLLRCKILAKYSAFPYVMRHQNAYNAPYPYNQIYTNLASWSNLPTYYVNHSFKDSCIYKGMSVKDRDKDIEEYLKTGKKLTSWKAYEDFEKIVEYKDLLDFVPKSICEFGNWKTHKKRERSRKEEYNHKLEEIKNIDKEKIERLKQEQRKLTYRELCDELGITYYRGGTKAQQMDIFKKIYDYEFDGKYRLC